MRIRGFPFGKAVRTFLANHRRCFVVEQNRDAQLRSLLAIETGTPMDRMIPVLDWGGLPLTAGFVVDEISRQMKLLHEQSSTGEYPGVHVGEAMRGVE
jgi:2-oxoglutarate ferredoxin oxidoreductase subunit alpha